MGGQQHEDIIRHKTRANIKKIENPHKTRKSINKRKDQWTYKMKHIHSPNSHIIEAEKFK